MAHGRNLKIMPVSYIHILVSLIIGYFLRIYQNKIDDKCTR